MANGSLSIKKKPTKVKKGDSNAPRIGTSLRLDTAKIQYAPDIPDKVEIHSSVKWRFNLLQEAMRSFNHIKAIEIALRLRKKDKAGSHSDLFYHLMKEIESRGRLNVQMLKSLNENQISMFLSEIQKDLLDSRKIAFFIPLTHLLLDVVVDKYTNVPMPKQIKVKVSGLTTILKCEMKAQRQAHRLLGALKLVMN